MLLAAPAALAGDTFEIQIYDGTANGRGDVGLETHFNVAKGGEAHLTFEPSYGITDFWELGAYLQFARLSDGSNRYAGAKLRSKLVTPPGWHPHLRFGFNVEIAVVPEEFSASRYGGELRPIAAWEDDRVLIAINPNVGLAFARPEAPLGPSVDPGAMAKVKMFSGKLMVGVEYYSELGTFSAIHALRDQGHQLFGAADIAALPWLELNVAVGAGLTSASTPWIVKAIAGISFGK